MRHGFARSPVSIQALVSIRILGRRTLAFVSRQSLAPMSSTNRYQASVDVRASRPDLFSYHGRPGCLGRMIPPWESVQIESTDDSLDVGSRVVLKARVLGVPVRWVAEHTERVDNERFVDIQVGAPCKSWTHTHIFHELSGTERTPPNLAGSRLVDQVDYQLPGGAIGELLGEGLIRRRLETMFAYRHRVLTDDLQLMADHPLPSARIAISGSTGLVGKALGQMARVLGHQTVSLVRGDRASENQIAAWSGDESARDFSGIDTVVHLAGKPIAKGRWNDAVKADIIRSRVEMTRSLCESIAKSSEPPRTLVCASATGIYGDRGDEELTESSAVGSGFLADVAEQWEAACAPAVDAGVRVVHARFGVILSPQGGALRSSLTPAKLCGGRLGSGSQWWSWIALDDAIGAIYHMIANQTIAGPVNVVAPNPVRNTDFASTLGNVIGRPALFPAPAFGLRLAMGEMADALLLASSKVLPQQLCSSGYRFRFAELEDALAYMLGKDRKVTE